MNNTDMMKRVFINREMKKDFEVTVEDYTAFRTNDAQATDGEYRKKKGNVPNNRWNEWKRVNGLIGKFNALRSNQKAPKNVQATDAGAAVLKALAEVPDAEALTLKIADLHKEKESLTNSLQIERLRADDLEKQVRRLTAKNESLESDKAALLNTIEKAVDTDASAELAYLYQTILGVLPAISVKDFGEDFFKFLLQHRLEGLK